MANKNTKQIRAILGKEKKDIIATRTRTQPGSSSLVVQKFEIPFGSQPRINTRGKVGRCKRKDG